ncbi:unnamed protein product [Oikopleura dioica]|uniref:Uncharacterized protein n=1 Tax=Oikopleura dioica TaxID=34765 RepID=E4X5J7_OIKDI|nr:unnamed protein product [Oikopleura dioica]
MMFSNKPDDFVTPFFQTHFAFNLLTTNLDFFYCALIIFAKHSNFFDNLLNIFSYKL